MAQHDSVGPAIIVQNGALTRENQRLRTELEALRAQRDQMGAALREGAALLDRAAADLWGRNHGSLDSFSRHLDSIADKLRAALLALASGTAPRKLPADCIDEPCACGLTSNFWARVASHETLDGTRHTKSSCHPTPLTQPGPGDRAEKEGERDG